MTKSCPTRQVAEGHISPGFYFSGDTLGDIISNQFIWRLPGSEHLSFGLNIVSGEEAAAPIFQFDYCSNIASNVIEDPYRGNVYQIPPELHGKAHPQCTYSTTTESYSSADEMASEMEKSASNDYSASVGGSYSFISGSASASFSQEKSNKEARKMSSKVSQSIFKTNLLCKSSYVEMDLNKVSLHPNFLNELDEIRDRSDMVDLVRKHGTHFYKKTFLGGMLTQLTITNSSKVTSDNKDEWIESASGSFSASVSSPSFSVSGSASAAVDKSQTEQQQQGKEESSTRSRMMVYGGSPAAFSPAEDGQSSPGFKEWAHSIDVLPVPVDYQLYPIKMLFNNLWVNKHGVKISEAWELGETMFYLENNYSPDSHDKYNYSLIFRFDENDIDMASIPILTIKYFEQDIFDNIREKTFTTPVPYIHTDELGLQRKYSYRATSQPRYHSDKYKAFSNRGNLNYNTETTTVSSDFGYEFIANYPIKFDFSGPNIFSSVKTPIITLASAYRLDTSQPFKLISWDSYDAILFNASGVITNSNRYYGITSFENKWAKNINGQARPEDFATSQFACVDKYCTDTLTFSFGDLGSYPGPLKYPQKDAVFSKRLDFLWNSIPEPNLLHNWFSFSNPVVDYLEPRLYVESGGKIGMSSRINWVKIMYPKEGHPWKFVIFAYHIKSESSLDVGATNWLNPPDRDVNYKYYFLQHMRNYEVPRQLFYYRNYNFRRFNTHDPNGQLLNVDSYNYLYCQHISNCIFNFYEGDKSYSFI
ncbi:hypothetical protein CYY_007926 [Polysphondylium violaceum]|uniref:MACPF domain-containing protein n=1 Tax=Polysphondylium violaceum TaxID=133409 RepID=A0A8J4PP30_9MYCE|nr:hypothetical protein CYY_007926 [Polysphondylium violaceum]